jgi:hypothetical protein
MLNEKMFSAEVYFFAPLEVLVLVSFVLLQWNNVIKTKGLFRSQFWRLKGTETASVQFWQRNSVMAKASVCGRDYIHQALKSEEKDFANSQLFFSNKAYGYYSHSQIQRYKNTICFIWYSTCAFKNIKKNSGEDFMTQIGLE